MLKRCNVLGNVIGIAFDCGILDWNRTWWRSGLFLRLLHSWRLRAIRRCSWWTVCTCVIYRAWLRTIRWLNCTCWCYIWNGTVRLWLITLSSVVLIWNSWALIWSLIRALSSLLRTICCTVGGSWTLITLAHRRITLSWVL